MTGPWSTWILAKTSFDPFTLLAERNPRMVTSLPSASFEASDAVGNLPGQRQFQKKKKKYIGLQGHKK